MGQQPQNDHWPEGENNARASRQPCGSQRAACPPTCSDRILPPDGGEPAGYYQAVSPLFAGRAPLVPAAGNLAGPSVFPLGPNMFRERVQAGNQRGCWAPIRYTACSRGTWRGE